MDTEREVVEQEILKEHISIFSRGTYMAEIGLLSRDELEAECMKQYDLAGNMLSKYRIYWQKSEDYRKQRDQEKLNASRWRALASEAQACLHESVQVFGAVQVMVHESEGYTHNAMVIIRRLVHGSAQNAASKAKAVLEHIFEAQRTSQDEFFDVPF